MRIIIGVLVVDSNQMQCQLLVSALRRRPEFKVTSCILDLDEILRVIGSVPVEVAILNVDNPRDGWPDMTVVRRRHLAHPVAKVILLDTYDRDIVVSAFRSGARGLFCFSRLLCKCIHSVHRGQVWANSEQMQFVIESLSQVPSLHMVNSREIRLLTPREEQVVALVAEGLSNREVAQELRLSEHPIKKYLFRISTSWEFQAAWNWCYTLSATATHAKPNGSPAPTREWSGDSSPTGWPFDRKGHSSCASCGPFFPSLGIFLQTMTVWPVLESMRVVTGTQRQVTVLAFSCLLTTQCSITSAEGGGIWLRTGAGAEGGGAAG